MGCSYPDRKFMIAPNLTHSADVKLWLHCDDQRYELSHLGGHVAILANAKSIPGGEAVIETIIDGKSDRYPIGRIPPQHGTSRRIDLG